MNSKRYTLSLLISIVLLLQVYPAKACGFYEDESDYRAMMFRAQVSDMLSLLPFLYTMNSTYYEYPQKERTDLKNEDRLRNCEEWLAQCDKTVKIDDIYKIQYQTDGLLYTNSADNGMLGTDFAENSLVKFLLKPQNKDLMEYMYFAKEMEVAVNGSNSRFESWNYNEYNYNWDDEDETSSSHANSIEKAEKAIKNIKSDFLKQRYAFQICRSAYYDSDYTTMINTYNKYFEDADTKSLMRAWSSLFKAMTLDAVGDKMEANRYYCQSFMYSDGKKNRSVQLFNSIDSIANPFEGYTSQEISIANTILALKNPGKALEQISAAYANDKSNPYIPFLVMREINKLEDWMITPLFYGKYSITNDDPFHCAYYNKWYEEYKLKYGTENEEKTEDQNINAENDKVYLARIKSTVLEFLPSAKGEARDFYAVSLAHLSLLQENAGNAREYLSMISADANPTIQLQKQIETAWLAIKTENINSGSFQKTFLKNIAELDKVQIDGYDSNQMLYTLTLSLANEYLKKGDRVIGNLLRMKSNYYKGGRSLWWADGSDSYYQTMQYFDYNATIEDMDKLINILEKKNKGEFETYLCDQTLSSVNAYKDLKGTLAFRENNIKLAYETFASMPQDYWSNPKGISYSSALNEDPFTPKGIGKNEDRQFNYAFNKTQFIKTLIDLEDQIKTEQNKMKLAECYIKLGNAYFNTTYNGNSWMMVRYSWSVDDYNYNKTDCLPEWMQNYMTGKKATEYYKKALSLTPDKEQKTFSNLMLYVINRDKYNLTEMPNDSISAHKYALDFCKLKETNIFAKYGCPGINYFIAAK